MENGFTATLSLEVFTQRNFVADFIRLNLNFIHIIDKFTLWATLRGGVRGNVCTSSIAHWKAHGRLFTCDNWTFFASFYGSDVISRYWSKSAFTKRGWVTLSANFRWKGHHPPTSIGIRKLEWLPCRAIPKYRQYVVWFLSQSMRVTDRWTELWSPRAR